MVLSCIQNCMEKLLLLQVETVTGATSFICLIPEAVFRYFFYQLNVNVVDEYKWLIINECCAAQKPHHCGVVRTTSSYSGEGSAVQSTAFIYHAVGTSH